MFLDLFIDTILFLRFEMENNNNFVHLNFLVQFLDFFF